ncbi:RNA ligase [Roridomyces roridus]|uniref:RNA ligase n=1 Tax=Roridomyces roridus TaxID=1738132 RepID=A0AAD7FW12_9AGAR|nr:RNA ligase [Roridomyces roridus]
MLEQKYYQVPSPFPTLARGLFTVEDADGKHRIAVRGYDKFFNIGEVGWTTWPAIEAHTTGPYTLSLKSNGCIIFIAALTPDKLLITSKHRMRSTTDDKVTHAGVGETWVRKYLKDKGRTEADLAAVLWEKNLTAVAELCDDSFEEHVLAYPPELTGLHLHGLNKRTKGFMTASHAEVDAFAEEWGFIKTVSIELPTVAAVRAFTADCAKTGSWNGVPVEGFVVRSHVAPFPPKYDARSAPPYPAGSSFFFKVKFGEPYMMYRDWREVTKMLLTMRNSGKGEMSVKKLPQSKMKRAETAAYAQWVVDEIQRDPAAFAQYTENKGIIAVRERFLAHQASKGEAVAVLPTQSTVDKTFGKTIIVPVAVPGCGKTAVSVALSHIFGFGHTQSDDVLSKKAAPVFVKNVTDLLKTHDVVIADKNNHLRQHREQLRVATASSNPPVRLLALNWSLDVPAATVHRICTDRVQARGTNHQTLRANLGVHDDVLWFFITQSEGLAAAEVDEIVEMNLGEGLDEAVQRAVDACVRVLGVPVPTLERVKEGVDKAKGYVPAVIRPDPPAPTKSKNKGPRYFALLPEVDLIQVLGPPLQGTPFWDALLRAKRVESRPHVTLVHFSEVEAEKGVGTQAKELWARCQELHSAAAPPLFKFKLGSVVWDDRVMAVTVDGIELAAEGGAGAGATFVEGLEGKYGKQRSGEMHITVGTRDGDVKPVEARGLVREWRRTGKAQAVELNGVVVTGRVKGL